MVYCRLAAQALQPLSDRGSFQDKKKALTPNFQNINFSTVCEGWLQCIASAMQRLPTWQNHLCQINNFILSELNLDHFKSMRIELQSQFYARWVIRVVGPNLEIPFCAQPCSGGLRVPSNAGPCCCRLAFSNKEMLLMISSFKDWFHYKKSSTEKQ